jgi:hypothetical protein
MMTTHDLPLPFEFDLSPGAALAARSLLEQKARDLRGVGDGKVATTFLSCSDSKLANLVREGKIPSFLDGAKRLYPIGALYDYLIAKAIESNPQNAEPLKARHPAGQFKKGHKPPPGSPAQREALKLGNEIRIAKARARRAAKEVAAADGA